MLALHHDARLLRDARAVERAHRAFDRTVGYYAADAALPLGFSGRVAARIAA